MLKCKKCDKVFVLGFAWCSPSLISPHGGSGNSGGTRGVKWFTEVEETDKFLIKAKCPLCEEVEEYPIWKVVRSEDLLAVNLVRSHPKEASETLSYIG